MNEKSVFRELASGLTDKERTELFDKIKKSLNIADKEAAEFQGKPLDLKEREILIQKEIDSASIFLKFFLWMKTLFSGKEKKEEFLNLKVRQIKKRIQRQNPGLTGFETRNLSPKLAELFFVLYVSIYPLITFYKKLWKNPEVFESFFSGLLEKHLDKAVNEIEDIISVEELEEVYAKEGLKDAMRKKLVDTINGYIDSLKDEIFDSLTEELNPLFYLKEIVLFPYNEFFKLFHANPNPVTRVAGFKSASAMVALRYLENMYDAVHMAKQIQGPDRFSKALTIQLGVLKELLDLEFKVDKTLEELPAINEDREEEKEEEPERKQKRQESLESGGKEFAGIYFNALKVYRKFSEIVPLAELIRYFKKDPYYRLTIYSQNLYLKDFYSSTLKMRLLPQLEEKFSDIRQGFIEKKIDALFEGRKLKNFQYYRLYTSVDYEKIGLPAFTNIKILTLLYNFLDTIYKEFIQEVIQILNRGILQQNRQTLNKLIVFAGGAEDILERIKDLDNSLSPEEDDGKLFQRLRYSLATNTSHQRLYRNLILQKDNEVKTLLGKGKDSLMEIKRVFDDILISPPALIKEDLMQHYFVQNKSRTLKELIFQGMESIDTFLKLIYQVEKMEKGS